MGNIVFLAEPKQPGDIAHFPGIEFADELTLPGETMTLDDVIVTALRVSDSEDVTDELLVTGSVVLTGTSVSWQGQAGIHNEEYDFYIVVTTSAGRVVTAVVRLPVRRRPY